MVQAGRPSLHRPPFGRCRCCGLSALLSRTCWRGGGLVSVLSVVSTSVLHLLEGRWAGVDVVELWKTGG